MKCHACKCNVTPVRPRTTWKIFTVALWSASLVLGLVFSVVYGLNFILIPFAIGIGLTVGSAARQLTSWTCPRCKAELILPEVQTKFDTLPLAGTRR